MDGRKQEVLQQVQSTRPTNGTTPERTRAGKWKQGVFGALSSRDFRMFWSGAFVSSIGSWLQMTAVLWFVRNIGSNTLVGFVNLVSWIPCLLLGLFAGAISDRMNRRRVLLVCQAVMMFCSILMGLSIHMKIHNAALIVLLAISGVAYAIFTPAWVSAIPFLVERDEILSGASLNNLQFNMARFIGPVIAGLLLVATSAYVPFYLNALTFAAFMALILVSRAEMPPPEPPRGNVGRSVIEGFKYVYENGWMGRILLAVCGLSFFGFSFMVLIPSVCKEILHVREHQYGFLLGMTGLGAAAGIAAVAALKKRVGLKTMMIIGTLLTAVFLLGFALSRNYWLSCFLALGAGGSFLVFNASAGAALQGNVSPEMQGRVSSMWVVAYIGIFPLGGLLLGYLSDALALRTSLLLAGFACVLVTLFVVFSVSVPGEKEAAGGRAQEAPTAQDTR
ncbi:MAG: MFS transporter [Candidatus Geothermincolia bacterium]